MPEQRAIEPSSPPPTLKGRINRLFDIIRPPHALDRQYHNKEVAAACKESGRDISESHLSELRRGIKENPTLRILDALAWFFQVRVGYFTDSATAAEVELELAVREAQLHAKLEAQRDAQKDMAEAALELQRAIRASGVTKTAHRATTASTDARERAAMMRALARLILEDEDED
jgi:transcriptional regulator with XRE-family HTH domain